jgi:CRISPR-associated protein Cas1
MIKRTIEISREPAHVTVRLDQLTLERNGQTVGSIPCEDVGILLVDHPGTTYTHAALTRLAAADAVVVICGRDHLPAGILLPLADHTQVVWRIRDQLAVSKPLIKQLWKQIVQAKIRAQACNLAPGPARTKLLVLARSVRSGDPKNIEAQASRVYWSAFFEGIVFRRDRDGDGPNPLLNYGYAVLRAAIARAIVAAGLLPSLGLHHSNRSNAFCLADDLIEPLRPLVDHRVKELLDAGATELDQPTKAALLDILTWEVRVGEQTGPLMVNLHRMVASLVHCFAGRGQNIDFPKPLTEPFASEAADNGSTHGGGTRTDRESVPIQAAVPPP